MERRLGTGGNTQLIIFVFTRTRLPSCIDFMRWPRFQHQQAQQGPVGSATDGQAALTPGSGPVSQLHHPLLPCNPASLLLPRRRLHYVPLSLSSTTAASRLPYIFGLTSLVRVWNVAWFRAHAQEVVTRVGKQTSGQPVWKQVTAARLKGVWKTWSILLLSAAGEGKSVEQSNLSFLYNCLSALIPRCISNRSHILSNFL